MLKVSKQKQKWNSFWRPQLSREVFCSLGSSHFFYQPMFLYSGKPTQVPTAESTTQARAIRTNALLAVHFHPWCADAVVRAMCIDTPRVGRARREASSAFVEVWVQKKWFLIAQGAQGASYYVSLPPHISVVAVGTETDISNHSFVFFGGNSTKKTTQLSMVWCFVKKQVNIVQLSKKTAFLDIPPRLHHCFYDVLNKHMKVWTKFVVAKSLEALDRHKNWKRGAEQLAKPVLFKTHNDAATSCEKQQQISAVLTHAVIDVTRETIFARTLVRAFCVQTRPRTRSWKRSAFVDICETKPAAW